MNLRGRSAALLLVLASHALLALWLRQLSPWSSREAIVVEATPLQLRIVPPSEPAPDRPLPRLRSVAPAMPQAPRFSLPELTFAPSATITIEQTARRPLAPPVSAGPARALELQLAPDRARARALSPRQQALTDPRSNSAPKTIESRIAAATGDLVPLTMEVLGEGRRRYRKGSACVEVHDARIAVIDPFNESFRPSPKQVWPCD